MHIHSAAPNPLLSAFGSGDWPMRPLRGAPQEGEASVSMRYKSTLSLSSTNASDAARAATAAEGSTYDAAIMRKQKGSLDILTQDGDRVRISFRSSAALVVKSGDAGTAEGATDASGSKVYAFASGRVQIAVQGELDEDELQAIGDLMDKVDELAGQFFGGDVESAFTAASSLGFDSGEIAGFALRLSLKESARVSIAAPPPAPPPAPLPAPEAAPESSAAATTDATPPAVVPAAEPQQDAPAAATTAPAEASPPEAAPAEAAPVEVPTSEPAPAESSSPPPAPAATLQESLGKFVRQILGSLAEQGSAGRLEFSMQWKLRVMVAAVESAPQAADANPAGTKLLTDSLQSLATKLKPEAA